MKILKYLNLISKIYLKFLGGLKFFVDVLGYTNP